MSQWKTYATERPTTPGNYLWRMPVAKIPEIRVVVRRAFRKRGAGYESVVSPEFDYWDGYRVHVPRGLEWRELGDGDEEWQNEMLVKVDSAPGACSCPFCKKTPWLSASQIDRFRSFVVSPSPRDFNRWTMHCCAWVRGPSDDDPRKLVERWNSALMVKP